MKSHIITNEKSSDTAKFDTEDSTVIKSSLSQER